jgi:hypothetical protein
MVYFFAALKEIQWSFPFDFAQGQDDESIGGCGPL